MMQPRKPVSERKISVHASFDVSEMREADRAAEKLSVSRNEVIRRGTRMYVAEVLGEGKGEK